MPSSATTKFTVHLRVGDPAGTRFVDVEVLAGTRASYTVLPRALLESLGAYHLESRQLFNSDGRSVLREIGQTCVAVEGRRGIVVVVFGEAGDESLLGSVTLSELALDIDAVTRRFVDVIPRL